MPIITAIGTANPAFKHQQTEILAFMLEALPLDEKQSRLLSLLYHRCGINTRYSVIPDYGLEKKDFTFYAQSSDLSPFPSIEQRMKLFETNALNLSVEAIKNTIVADELKGITHLITVTCTGLTAPGLDLQLVSELALSPEIFRTSVNFMGCYAAIHALKLANSLAKSSDKAKVLVVCTELCTIHFQQNIEIDQLTSSLLFGDGAAACIVESDGENKSGLSIDGFFSKIVSEGKQDMAWELSSTGFLMTLSNHIPRLVGSEIENLLDEALIKIDWKTDEIVHWAIHPGGKDILAATEKALNLTSSQLIHSYNTLRNYGNMSSPTILFVLKEVLEVAKNNEKVFSAAFGPGLTLESAQFTAKK